MKMTTDERVLLITGCSGQLGIQYSMAFLNAGYTVVGLDLENNEQVNSICSEYPLKYSFFRVDITSRADLIEIRNTVMRKFGRIDVLINNAAIDSPPNSSSKANGSFEDFSEELWDKIVNVNLKGTYLCCQIFGKQMVLDNGGSIINISSIYGQVSPDPRIYDYRFKNNEVFYKPVAYSASKGGLHNLTRYLAVYWAKKNIRVNTVVLAGVENGQDQEFIESYCSRIPIGRMAKPDEYNGLMLFLASESSSYITGSTIVADGGWTSI